MNATPDSAPTSLRHQTPNPCGPRVPWHLLWVVLWHLGAAGWAAAGAKAAVHPDEATFATLIGKVVHVSDGDTITILDENKQEQKIRLAGIDAPEKSQAFGQKAKQTLNDRLTGSQVTVRYQHKDRYQRVLGIIWLGDQDVNLEMVRLGLAWHYVAYARDQSDRQVRDYAQAEREAKDKHLGLWIDPAPTPPWDYRRQQRGQH